MAALGGIDVNGHPFADVVAAVVGRPDPQNVQGVPVLGPGRGLDHVFIAVVGLDDLADHAAGEAVGAEDHRGQRVIDQVPLVIGRQHDVAVEAIQVAGVGRIVDQLDAVLFARLGRGIGTGQRQGCAVWKPRDFQGDGDVEIRAAGTGRSGPTVEAPAEISAIVRRGERDVPGGIHKVGECRLKGQGDLRQANSGGSPTT
jgi:hypothetical protein